MKHSITVCFLICALASLFFPLAFATVHYDPANGYLWTFPAFGTAMRFASAQTFGNPNPIRLGNFWYFNGTLEFSVQNGNLTVDSLWAGNIFQGHIAGTDGQLAIVSIYNVLFTVPSAVLSSSASVSQVSDSTSFLSSATSVWFYDSASGRTYIKVLIDGYTSFSADYNAATPGGGGGGGGGGGQQQNVQVSDCVVNVASGGSATASVSVSWNFVGSVSLAQMTFQGLGKDWLEASTLPMTLTQAHPVSVFVSVPQGTQDGNYTMQVSSQFNFNGGAQSVISHITVNVGPVQQASALPWWLSWATPYLDWIMLNIWVVIMSAAMVFMLSIVAVVARRRR